MQDRNAQLEQQLIQLKATLYDKTVQVEEFSGILQRIIEILRIPGNEHGQVSPQDIINAVVAVKEAIQSTEEAQ